MELWFSSGLIALVLGLAVYSLVERPLRLHKAVERATTDLRVAERELRVINSELEQRVADRTEKLNKALHDAKRANSAKSEFLANVSHELRTPLNAIIGFSETLERGLYGPLNSAQKERVDDIFGAGTHLLSLIDDVLDLSKIESLKFKPNFEEVDVGDAVEDALRLVSTRAADSAINLSQNVAPGLPGLHADRRLLRQMLTNLLTNAIKFTDAGGSVTVSASMSDDGGLRFEVQDNLANAPKISHDNRTSFTKQDHPQT